MGLFSQNGARITDHEGLPLLKPQDLFLRCLSFGLALSELPSRNRKVDPCEVSASASGRLKLNLRRPEACGFQPGVSPAAKVEAEAPLALSRLFLPGSEIAKPTFGNCAQRTTVRDCVATLKNLLLTTSNRNGRFKTLHRAG